MMKERESFQLLYGYSSADPHFSGHTADFAAAEEDYPRTLQRALVGATTRISKSTFSLRGKTNQQHTPRSHSLSGKALMMQGSTFPVSLQEESSHLAMNAEQSAPSSLEDPPHRSQNALPENGPPTRDKEPMVDKDTSTDHATKDGGLTHSIENHACELHEDAQESILASKAEVLPQMLVSHIHNDTLCGSPLLLTPRPRRGDRTRGVLPHASNALPPGPWRHVPRHSPRVHHDHLHCHVRYDPESQRSPLSPRPGHLSYCGAMTDHPLRAATPTSPSLSHSDSGGASSILSIPCSPGHQIQPTVDPGHILGVHCPLRTQRHALYDVPLYGIENFEVSSSRYSVSMMSHSEGDHGGAGDAASAEAGGHQLAGSTTIALSKHREHIWAIAHEDEYGPALSMGDGSGGQTLLQGRYKRLQRWVPMPPSMSSNSASGSGHCGPLVGHPPSPLKCEIGRVAESASETSQQRQPQPVSQGVYGPDSFMDSIENSKRISPVGGGRSRCEVMASKHWKNCMCLLLLVAVATAVLVIELHKKSGASIASAAASGVGSEAPLDDEGGDGSTSEIRGRPAVTHKGGSIQIAPGTVSKTKTASPPTPSATRSTTDSPAQPPRQTAQTMTPQGTHAPRQTAPPPSGDRRV